MKNRPVATTLRLMALLFFPALLPATGQVPLIAPGATWKYVIGTNEASSPINLWRQIGFEDAAWGTGTAPIGYGETGLGTTLPESDEIPGQNWTSVYLRKTFTVFSPADVVTLSANVRVDDGAVVWINGLEIGRINVAAGELPVNATATLAEETRTLSVTIPNTPGLLQPGMNVMAIHAFNGNLASSDFTIDADLTAVIDTQPPQVVTLIPPATATVRQLTSVEVIFDEPVLGLDAADLLINTQPATNVQVIAPDHFLFEFPQPETGAVTVAWVEGHGITDAAATPNPFPGGSWGYTLDPNATPATVIISEFMADNDKTINDQDGDSSDWIELHNAGTVSVNLDGWYLTDDRAVLTRWRIPNVTLLPGQYLLIFASSKNLTNATGQLHTSFDLRARGEYLGLIAPDLTIVSEFAPTFPEQLEDVSYGRDALSPELVGFFDRPTPGAPNATQGTGFGPEVVFSQPSRTFLNGFSLTLSTPQDPTAVIRYVLVTNGVTAAATNVPTAAAPLYTAPLPVTGTIQVRARAFSPGKLPGPPRTENYVQLNPNLADFTSDLPLILIHNFGTSDFPSGAGDTLDRSSIVMIFDTILGRSSLTNLPDVSTRSGINLRGSSTQGYAKRSYAVEFWDELNNDQALPVLGLPSESDWVLYAPNQFDTSLIHNPLAYEISNDLNQYAARTRMVEVFVNTAGGAVTGPVPAANYNGIYVLEEKIKRDQNRVDIDALEPQHTTAPNITGGYLLKVDRRDSNERDFSAGGLALIYQAPDGLEMVTPQRQPQAQYIQNFINTMANSIPAGTYSNYIDEIAWIDHHLVNVLTLNADAFRLSGFLFKARDELDRHGVVIKTGKLHMGPVWDFDRGMGTSRNDQRPWDPFEWRGQGGDAGTDFFNSASTFSNPWYRQLFTRADFFQKWIDRYQELRETYFATNFLFQKIDRMGAELREAHPREVQRWGGSSGSDTRPRSGTESFFGYAHTFPTPGTFQGEIDHQKRWFADRAFFMDTNFIEKPEFNRAGGQITPGVQLTISGPPGATLYYTLDGTDPRAGATTPSAGAVAYTGPITLNVNARVVARAFNLGHSNLIGANNPPIASHWSGPRTATYFTELPALRITELMFHPLPAPTNSPFLDGDFEFIEVKNTGPTDLNLRGYKLRGGVDFTFPNLTLPSGGLAVVASYVPAFTSRYGAGPTLAGEYRGLLANEGDHVVLEGPLGEIIHDFEFDDRWHPATDGFGFSLVPVNPNGPLSAWTLPSGWRPSAALGGSPGQDDGPAPGIPVVLINEALTHTDLPAVDFIELFNPNPSPVNVGGWYLSDDFDTPKYRIPDNAVIPAQGWLVIVEPQYNATPGSTNSFNLRSAGDEVYLFSADAAGNLTGYIHGFAFGAALNGVSFGRYVNSVGEEHFVAQTAPTPLAANSGPRVGPIVISEIMYHPTELLVGNRLIENSRDEYVELQNISGADVPLFDPNAPTNMWRLRDAVQFSFPPNYTFPANGRLLVVSFDPVTQPQMLADFRARYGLSPSVTILGPFQGQLSNGGESVELVQPDVVVFYTNQVEITGVLIDQVAYGDDAPWPAAADGYGASLQRLQVAGYGNDPANWVAAPPTPSAGYVAAPLPAITTHPVSQSVLASSNVTFSVTATGPEPLTYQWQQNGTNLVGATSPVLSLSNIGLPHAGTYQVAVFSAGGAVISDPAMLTVLVRASILQQPLSLAVRPGNSAALRVVLSKFGPVTYQWRKNGVPIPGATASFYFIGSVTRADDAVYDVVINDGIGLITSAQARLTVLIDPVILNLSTNYTVIQGGNLLLSVEVDGTLPMSYRWRRRTSLVRQEIIDAYQSFVLLINLQPTTTGPSNLYTVVLTNAALVTPGRLSSNILVTLLLDNDGDRIPNDWESAFGLDANSAADAALDTDNDGLTNAEEYTAGTDPTDPESYLKVDDISSGSPISIQFHAVSNTTYSVLYKNSLDLPTWSKLADIAAAVSNRVATVQDPTSATNRFYRLITPRQPLP